MFHSLTTFVYQKFCRIALWRYGWKRRKALSLSQSHDLAFYQIVRCFCGQRYGDGGFVSCEIDPSGGSSECTSICG